MHTHKWYQRRLAKYFDEHYILSCDIVEFYPDPTDNQWLFELPGLDVLIKLTCQEDGTVVEHRYMKSGDSL